MRFSDSYLLWAGLAFLANFGATSAEGSNYGSFHTKPRDYDARDYYAVHLDGRDPEAVAKHFGLQHEGVIGELKGHHLFSTEKDEPHVDVVKRGIEHFQARRRKREPIPEEEAAVFESIKLHQKQHTKKLHKRYPPPPKKDWQAKQAKKRQDLNSIAAGVGRPTDSSMIKLQKLQKALDIEDPIFKDQWHLLNYRSPGHDVNVTGLWLEGITGHNATVSIVDDGLDMYSNDLKDNYFAAGSYDFNDHQAEPRPRLSDDRHGTRCAGEIAAVKNDVCGVGVAYDAKVSGIRILSKLITDADEAVALNYAFNENHIYSCSWGPPDDGQAMDEPGILIKRAIVNGINEGRSGLGSVFVFATGNGAANGDNCNFDGYTNSIYSITVGAIDHKGLHPYYSEECSAQLVVTYSSGSGESIHTTDVSQGGSDRCYDRHGGTSAAAPLAAGIYALVLSVRPDLTWRDLQYLTVQTAVMVEEEDEDWITTHAGYKYNHKFGYGKLDAYRIVHAAKDFKTVKPQAWFHSPVLAVGQSIPENDQGLISTFTITKDMLQKANLEKIEHVTVKMNLRHDRRGDVSVDLVSPTGVISKIAVPRESDSAKSGYKEWTFMSVVHWGEDGIGEWKIITRDTISNGKTGTLDNWQIDLWGPSIDPAKAVKHPLPGDKEHDQSAEADHSTSTSIASVQTTTLPAPAKPVVPTKPPTEPTVDRPVNSKPEDLASKPAEKPAAPTPTGEKAAESEAANDETKRPGMIPSFLPTFGVSGTKQAWIYASAAFIGLFVAGLGIFMCIQKRKRAKQNSRDDYEFAVLENEEEMLTGAGKEKGTKKKARDLYDAFGASDDEDVLSDSDDDMGEKGDGGYRDVDSDDDSDSQGSPSNSNR